MKRIYLLTFLFALPAFLLISCQSGRFDPYSPLPPEGEEAGEEKVEVEEVAPTPAPPQEVEKKQAISSYGKIPPYFIQSQGQQNMPETVRYYIKGSKGTVYLTTTEVVFDFLREKEPEEGAEEEELEEERPRGPEGEREKKKSYDRLVFRLKFEGANPEVEVAGEKELPGKINYFIGSQNNWRANISTFQEVVYREIYPEIDLKFYFLGANLESVFIIKPGGDPGKIVLAYQGIDDLELKPSGELVALTPFGGFVEKAPRIFQEIEGKEVEKEGSYQLLGEKEYTYDIPSYDSDFPLLIE